MLHLILGILFFMFALWLIVTGASFLYLFAVLLFEGLWAVIRAIILAAVLGPYWLWLKLVPGARRRAARPSPKDDRDWMQDFAAWLIK